MLMPNDNSAPLIGRTLAHKYTIESVVGTGAMGTIYRARQIALDKTVAVKVLHQSLAQDPSFIERFKIEAFSASRLEHPNSLRVLDFGKDDELLYLVMEYVEADNLLTIMQKEWPFEDERVAQITSQVLAALAKAHDVGIVHRDLKPENILVLRGTDDEGNPIDIVKVCDFGITKLAMPKSHTLTMSMALPSSSVPRRTRMFSGFRSRCTMPTSCALASAARACDMICATRSSSKGHSFCMMVRRLSASTYSITR